MLAGCCIVYLNKGGGYCILGGVFGEEKEHKKSDVKIGFTSPFCVLLCRLFDSNFCGFAVNADDDYVVVLGID